MRLTSAAERAVSLLVENPGITARGFGLLMWPDSPHHERSQGSLEQGMARGRVMWLNAGAYLHHLGRKGLAEIVRPSHGPFRWRATDAGRTLLTGDGAPSGSRAASDREGARRG